MNPKLTAFRFTDYGVNLVFIVGLPLRMEEVNTQRGVIHEHFS